MPEYPKRVTHKVSLGPFAATVDAELNPFGPDRCPECGRDLTEWSPEGQILDHWGGQPLPIVNENFLARARIAYLRGEPLPKE